MAKLLRSAALAALLASFVGMAGADTPPPPPNGPAALLAAAPAADWTPVDPGDLMVIDFANGGRVVILLAGDFAPAHVANMRALAKAHWYDGLVIERVQDNYVTQWGDPDGEKPLPAGIDTHPPAEYDRPAAGVPFQALAWPDTYAEHVGASGAFPLAESGDRAWLTHCYGMVGIGRGLNPDTGSGAELYAVIGQPARGLDRNIAVVGRVVSGMDRLSALPRGTADLGFYADPKQRVRIARVRLASDLPAAGRPRFEALKPESQTYAAWLRLKANRQDTFFVRPAGALDVCNALPPVRAPKG